MTGSLKISNKGIAWGILSLMWSPILADGQEAHEKGKEIYAKLCAECHGENGEGVADEYDEPLTGDRSLKALAKRIDRTMPEDEEELCVGEDAEAVAAYIYDAFYSPSAQARIQPVKRQLSRLTANQFRVSVSDSFGFFNWDDDKVKSPERGLKATYWGGSNFGDGQTDNKETDKSKVSFERRDGKVSFDFGDRTPDDEKFNPGQFSIRWEGSLIVEETGQYEIALRTRNGARLFLNDTWETPLINAWVSSGTDVREEKVSVSLLGGRAYPIKLEYFKYKENSASIELAWKTPHGVMEVVPQRNLSPETVQKRIFSLQTQFPPDDRSDGYERGTSISKEWLSAVDQSALEAGEYAFENFQKLTNCEPEERDKEEGFRKIRDFVKRYVSLVWRKPVSDEDVARLLGNDLTPAGVKKAVVAALVSPLFLYPDLSEEEAATGHVMAGRLALAMWDSVPDKDLWNAAEQGNLVNPDQVRQQAQRMLDDPRTKNKLRGFFHHWLELKDTDALAKDPKIFPGFGPEVVVDLAKSLDLFIDHVVWESDSDYRQLLTADYMFLNSRLAPIYGKQVEGEDFQKVSFEGGARSGILTHPYMLTTFAYYNNTSPIHRGVFLTRNIVGRMLKMPPQAIEFKDSDFDPTLTMREKVTDLTKSNACMACHSSINPLGFSLESFDAIGRWRDQDNGKPVNTRSDFFDDNGETVPIGNAKDVASFAIASESAQQAFIRHLFHHLVKQPVAANRRDGMEVLLNRFHESGYKIRDLVVESVVMSTLREQDGKPLDTAAK